MCIRDRHVPEQLRFPAPDDSRAREKPRPQGPQRLQRVIQRPFREVGRLIYEFFEVFAAPVQMAEIPVEIRPRFRGGNSAGALWNGGTRGM